MKRNSLLLLLALGFLVLWLVPGKMVSKSYISELEGNIYTLSPSSGPADFYKISYNDDVNRLGVKQDFSNVFVFNVEFDPLVGAKRYFISVIPHYIEVDNNDAYLYVLTPRNYGGLYAAGVFSLSADQNSYTNLDLFKMDYAYNRFPGSCYPFLSWNSSCDVGGDGLLFQINTTKPGIYGIMYRTLPADFDMKFRLVRGKFVEIRFNPKGAQFVIDGSGYLIYKCSKYSNYSNISVNCSNGCEFNLWFDGSNYKVYLGNRELCSYGSNGLEGFLQLKIGCSYDCPTVGNAGPIVFNSVKYERLLRPVTSASFDARPYMYWHVGPGDKNYDLILGFNAGVVGVVDKVVYYVIYEEPGVGSLVSNGSIIYSFNPETLKFTELCAYNSGRSGFMYSSKGEKLLSLDYAGDVQLRDATLSSCSSEVVEKNLGSSLYRPVYFDDKNYDYFPILSYSDGNVYLYEVNFDGTVSLVDSVNVGEQSWNTYSSYAVYSYPLVVGYVLGQMSSKVVIFNVENHYHNIIDIDGSLLGVSFKKNPDNSIDINIYKNSTDGKRYMGVYHINLDTSYDVVKPFTRIPPRSLVKDTPYVSLLGFHQSVVNWGDEYDSGLFYSLTGVDGNFYAGMVGYTYSVAEYRDVFPLYIDVSNPGYFYVYNRLDGTIYRFYSKRLEDYVVANFSGQPSEGGSQPPSAGGGVGGGTAGGVETPSQQPVQAEANQPQYVVQPASPVRVRAAVVLGFIVAAALLVYMLRSEG